MHDFASPDHPSLAPFDEYNRQLLNNVHPQDWSNPTPAERYHLVVVGAGTAGLVTAIVAAGLGARVALVERHLMGGDCLNVGCVPSKAVISAARAWNRRHRQEFFAPPTIGAGDFAAVFERMRRLRATISHIDGAARFREAGIDVFLGHGKFVDSQTVVVDGNRLRFRKAVIATGARAAAPPIPGLDKVDYLTNETVFSLTERPVSLAIIGAGPIGCEMAQSFASFGSAVTLFDLAPQVLIREDPDAAKVVQEALAADGVRLALGAKLLRIENHGGGKRVVFSQGEGTGGETAEEQSVTAESLLVAVGRKPNTEDLGLEEAGVRHDNAGVWVDSRLRTSNSRIFAAGDITPHPKFTHLADAHAGIVIQNALFFGRKKTADLIVPWCTYTSPEVAHVGLYEHEAKKAGKAVDVIKVSLEDVDRATLDGEEQGFLKVVLESGSDRILGATLVAAHAGDMLPALCLAITHRLGLGKFAATIFPYPTQGEVLKKAANQWRKRKLSASVKKVFEVWFRLFR